MTEIVFAAPNVQADAALAAWDWDARPLHLLASFAYPVIMERALGYPAASRMLDSGAFTAYHLGKEIDLDALIAEAKSDRWDEVVALDVIGDAEASYENAVAMRDAGCCAMPVFHIGEPWDLLEDYLRGWHRVGLSCRFGEPQKESLRFYEQCFARGWPHSFHSFGWVDRDALIRFPFASADAATWVVAAARYRNMALPARGRVQQHHLPVGGEQSTSMIRTHLEATWRLQEELTAFWASTLAKLEAA